MIKKETLYPSRIGCPSIPGAIKGIIMSLKGVKEVKVQYKERSLEVMFDDAEVSSKAIIKKIGDETGLAMRKSKPDASDKKTAAETCELKSE